LAWSDPAHPLLLIRSNPGSRGSHGSRLICLSRFVLFSESHHHVVVGYLILVYKNLLEDLKILFNRCLIASDIEVVISEMRAIIDPCKEGLANQAVFAVELADNDVLVPVPKDSEVIFEYPA
jgi:hypothetical protein